MDYLTKWPEVFTTTNQEALTIAKLITERIVPVHGVPQELLSDRGSNFLSKLMYELYRLLGIHKVNTCAYHPRTDGMIEQFNCTLLNMLAKSAEADPRNWDKRLPHVLFAYRTTPHDSTGETPFRLLYGREAVLPTDEVLFPPAERREVIIGTYLEEMATMFSDAWALAQKRIKASQERQKKQFDKHATLPSYQVGDRVLLHMPAKTSGELRKLALPNQGPYRITKAFATRVLIVPEDRPHATPLWVNWDRL